MADFMRVPSPAARTTTAAGLLALTVVPFGYFGDLPADAPGSTGTRGGSGVDLRRIPGGYEGETRAGPDLVRSGPDKCDSSPTRT
ncbi:hypothetical protein GCM10010329_47520 [Streptomyces spiroverticillatus]|uniref:Uncharacterized protein n=1 Tax=Streptomyces finlayi TaxID=67296 RepID=A0A918X1K4_9ACTN|nr:hypothetical protein GCM10010329_47520 [Streptomyces spiroverticillatus]GHD02208.1 hypothetical protein GCM10010334_48470 [Streptomyces finlayi]